MALAMRTAFAGSLLVTATSTTKVRSARLTTTRRLSSLSAASVVPPGTASLPSKALMKDGARTNSGSRSSPSERDDAAQHGVGGQHADLAFDLHQRCVAQLRGLGGIVADRAQIARIDQDLRDRGVFMRRHNDEQRRQGERRDGRAQDRRPAAPQHATRFCRNQSARAARSHRQNCRSRRLPI